MNVVPAGVVGGWVQPVRAVALATVSEIKAMDASRLADNDPRAAVILKRLHEWWDNAPASTAINGASVRIPG